MTKYSRCNQPSYDVYFPPNIRHHQIDVWFKVPLVFACYGADFVRVHGSHICKGITSNNGPREVRFREKQYELRFPRMQQIHHDRDWMDCTSLAELQEMAARTPLSEVSGNEIDWRNKLQSIDDEHLRRNTIHPPTSCMKLIVDVNASSKPDSLRPRTRPSTDTRASRSLTKSLRQLDQSFVTITTQKVPKQTRKRALHRLALTNTSTMKKHRVHKPAPKSSSSTDFLQDLTDVDPQGANYDDVEVGLTRLDSIYTNTSSKLASSWLFFAPSILELFHHQEQNRLHSIEDLLEAAGWTCLDRKNIKPGIIFVSDSKEAVSIIQSLESRSKVASAPRARISVVDMSNFVKTDDLDSSEYYPYS